MLKTPSLRGRGDPILEAIALAGGRFTGYRQIREGVLEIGSFSGDLLIWGRNAPHHHMGYPEVEGLKNPYGVCDSPQQFLKKYEALLEQDERTFVVTFTHVAKDPGNKFQGGGWRWHKWGPYIGEGEPTQEYLDDEEKFDQGVYCYHVYQIDGPNKNPYNPW